MTFEAARTGLISTLQSTIDSLNTAQGSSIDLKPYFEYLYFLESTGAGAGADGASMILWCATADDVTAPIEWSQNDYIIQIYNSVDDTSSYFNISTNTTVTTPDLSQWTLCETTGNALTQAELDVSLQDLETNTTGASLDVLLWEASANGTGITAGDRIIQIFDTRDNSSTYYNLDTGTAVTPVVGDLSGPTSGGVSVGDITTAIENATNLDGIETSLTNIEGFVDGIEGVLGTIDTNIATLVGKDDIETVLFVANAAGTGYSIGDRIVVAYNTEDGTQTYYNIDTAAAVTIPQAELDLPTSAVSPTDIASGIDASTDINSIVTDLGSIDTNIASLLAAVEANDDRELVFWTATTGGTGYSVGDRVIEVFNTEDNTSTYYNVDTNAVITPVESHLSSANDFLEAIKNAIESQVPADGSLTIFRDYDIDATPVQIKSGAGFLYDFKVIKTGNQDAYVKFYDTASAPTVGGGGSTQPVWTEFVARRAQTRVEYENRLEFTNGIWVAVTRQFDVTNGQNPNGESFFEGRYL